MDGTEGNKETAKQNHEDDTLSICGSEDGEIVPVKHGIHLAGGVSIIDPDFRGPISICLKNSHQCNPYEIKVNDQIAQMMIERVDELKWIEGTENDFKIKEASENASEGQRGRKRIRNQEGVGSTGI